MSDLREFDPFSPLPDDLNRSNSLPSPMSPLQSKLGDLSISSVEDVGGKKGFVDDEGEQGGLSQCFQLLFKCLINLSASHDTLRFHF